MLIGRKPTFNEALSAFDKVRFCAGEYNKSYTERDYTIPKKADAQYISSDVDLGGRAARLSFNDPRGLSDRRNRNIVQTAIRKTRKARKQLTVRQNTVNKSRRQSQRHTINYYYYHMDNFIQYNNNTLIHALIIMIISK